MTDEFFLSKIQKRSDSEPDTLEISVNETIKIEEKIGP